MDPLTMALILGGIGAFSGAMMDKKQPLRGAALGGLGGATLGAGGAGLLGAGAAGGSLEAAPGIASVGGGTSGVLTGSVSPLASGVAPEAISGSSPGLLEMASPYLKAGSSAASIYGQVKPQEVPTVINGSPMVQNMGNGSLASLVSGMNQQQAERMAAEKQARMARRRGYGLIG